MVHTKVNLSKGMAIVNAIAQEAKKRLEVEIDKEVADLIERLKTKKVEILAGVVIEVTEMARMDDARNEIIFISHEKEK